MCESDGDPAISPSRWSQKVLGKGDLVKVMLVLPKAVLAKESHIPFAREDGRFSLRSAIAQQPVYLRLIPSQELNRCFWRTAVGNDQCPEEIRRGVGVLQEKTTGQMSDLGSGEAGP
jgi:hypothetical protein